ncbi:hypothetical protein CFN78_04735 [Amycolatopsis antarctica]|uniref:Dihydrodipicolinate synthase family protein n=1 Tax=Amycolatopsis antarctica TaxID=1854586 RepID=A0A263D7H9_9PSEU|nr:dihydrodipicolinate synthase family protein [Amycolatopsis antarctica]OZM74430.1 hypothetical protein CFN78_04735 [Amycolatopsis antarctica]
MVQRPAVLAAVPTPFDENGEVDLVAVRQRVTALAGVVDGVFVAGPEGEFPALDDHERTDLAVIALAAAGRDAVMVHTGAPSARQAVELTRRAVRRGARRFAAVTPYFYRSPLSRIVDYYRDIRSAAGDGELHARVDPEHTGADLGPDDVAWIVARADLNGVLLGGSAAARLAEFRAALPADVRLYAAGDVALPRVAADGGTGVVSGVAAVFPEAYRRLADAIAEGDAERVHELGARLDGLAGVAGASVAHLKMAQSLRGWSLADVRAAVAPVDAETISALGKYIADLG